MARTKTNEYRYAGSRGAAVDMARAARLDAIRGLKTKCIPLSKGQDAYILAFYAGADVMQVRFAMTAEAFRIMDVIAGNAQGIDAADVRAVAEESIHRNWSAWVNGAAKGAN